MKSNRSKRIGNHGEIIALTQLHKIGVHMPEEIGTPFVVTGRGKGNIYRGFFKDRVSGDFRGVRSDGISVLVEVKTTDGGNLTWGIMKKHGEHQAERLTRHARYAISLVVWVRGDFEAYVLQWPIPGFGPRKSITPERASELHLDSIDKAI